MGRRTLLLIASILVAAVGTGLVGLYALNADDRAKGNARLTTAFVAIAAIPAGAVPDTRTARSVQRPVGDLPADYLPSLASIKGSAIARIVPGQLLQTSLFGAGGAASSQTVKPGYEALSVDLGDPERTASLLAPGSTVRIWKLSKNRGGASEVFKNLVVTVIAVSTSVANGQNTSTAAKNPSSPLSLSNVTLELTRNQVGELLDAQASGTLYFSWVPPDGTAG